MNHKALIIGAGTYGQVYCEYLKEQYQIIGFIDDNEELHGKTFCDTLVLGNFEYLENHISKSINIFVPIGDNKVRVSLINRLEELGYQLPSFIHKKTEIHSSVTMGKTVYILPGCNIMPLTTIKDYVMISIGVNIAHHSILGKGSFYSLGTTIGASVNIDDCAYFGTGCTIMLGVNYVGKNTVIGAGAVIIRDVPDNAVVVGNPGRIIRYNKPD